MSHCHCKSETLQWHRPVLNGLIQVKAYFINVFKIPAAPVFTKSLSQRVGPAMGKELPGRELMNEDTGYTNSADESRNEMIPAVEYGDIKECRGKIESDIGR